jgi:hypothetical protein
MIDIQDSIKVIWDALHGFREDCIPEGDFNYDGQWDDICNAMAAIEENLKEKS